MRHYVDLPVIGRVPDGASREEIIAHLREAARLVRRKDLTMVANARLGHLGGEYSITDALVTLYLAVLNVRPNHLDDPERDRLILSKGHTAVALYCTLAAAGLLDLDELETFAQPQSRLNGHPATPKLPGVEASTGPLGHGLPIAVGTALAAKLDGSPRRTFVLTGDGELQEGSNWEAFMCAAHYGLDNLCVFTDRNLLQQGARTEHTNNLDPLGDKLRAFGWNVIEINGHDYGELLDAFTSIPHASGKPTFILAHTHKGHPISFMSDQIPWHHKLPTDEQVVIALGELGGYDGYTQDGKPYIPDSEGSAQ
ncbi:MAG: transketolase [Actinomycetaceae bacterium]|nr:transketolase [Actinomycetaceae bacterium]